MKPDEVREAMKAFYDTYAWKRAEVSNEYVGNVLHIHQDEAVARYCSNNEMRYKKYFTHVGDFFLDAGCGPNPRLNLSDSFQKHVCVDFSLNSLKGARECLGDRGLYVVADLAALPFPPRIFDGTLAAHCLYHVHKDGQPTVLKELCRVTKVSRSIIVFYASNYNLISLVQILGDVTLRLLNLLLNILSVNLGQSLVTKKALPFYYFTYNPFSLTKRFGSAKITCLQTFTKVETMVLKKVHLLNLALPVFALCERTFPHAMLYVGKYVTIHIQRESNGE